LAGARLSGVSLLNNLRKRYGMKQKGDQENRGKETRKRGNQENEKGTRKVENLGKTMPNRRPKRACFRVLK